MRCEKCNGELNTACVCTKCGHYNPLPRPLITADPDPMRKHREHNPMSNVMEMRELKPCPFCGGVYPDDLSVDEDMVLCDACGCIGVRLSEWNTRYQPADWVAVSTETLLRIRDLLVIKEVDEAYHLLYKLASPNFDKNNPWKEWEEAIGYKEPYYLPETERSGDEG